MLSDFFTVDTAPPATRSSTPKASRSSLKTPVANAFAERWIRSIRSAQPLVRAKPPRWVSPTSRSDGRLDAVAIVDPCRCVDAFELGAGLVEEFGYSILGSAESEFGLGFVEVDERHVGIGALFGADAAGFGEPADGLVSVADPAFEAPEGVAGVELG